MLSSRNRRGFSIVEVMVALMVTLIFVSITMQMFVSAAFLRARADRYNNIYNWIQEDYETVFSKANQYEMQALPYSRYCQPVSPESGLAANFISDSLDGLGGATVTIGPRSFGGQTFNLTRTATYATSIDPEKLVQLQYSVSPEDGGTSAFQYTGEVTIYAGFKCPP